MKKSSLILIIWLLTINVGSSQTNVSGGIFTNTTWNLAGSPYIVIDTVVVFPGVRLTINPGVTVKFDNTNFIEVRGQLRAVGTVSDTITFTSNSATPTKGIYIGIYNPLADSMIFNYCKFQYAVNAIYHGNTWISIINCRFENNVRAAWGDGPIDSCVFINNDFAVFASYYKSIRNSKFFNNVTGISACYQNVIYNNIFCGNNLAIYMMQGDSIYNNTIMYNDTGIFANPSTQNIIYNNVIARNTIGVQRYTNGPPQLDNYTNNKICLNSLYNIRTQAVYNLDVTNNCWCDSNEVAIAQTIYDGYDNINIGLVNYIPFINCDTTVIPNSSYCSSTPTGINNLTFSNHTHFDIYPNPVNSTLTLFVSKRSDVLIFNLLGEIILKKNFSLDSIGKVKIDVSSLSTGIYFIKVDNEVKKFVKE